MISKDFLYGGHAIFSVENPVGEYFTYRITAPDNQDPQRPIWFVGVLTGPDNTSDYSYLGLLNDAPRVWTTAKSKFTNDSKPVKVIQWAVKCIFDGKLPEGYKIHHIGRCGKCGRPLTTPESVESGIGPICAGRN